ncbi:MAG: MarR family winged helix-turn-helix transcriptional regulator [Acutalibacteraceae bacterium]
MKKAVHKDLRSLSHMIIRMIENFSSKKKIESMSGNNGCIIGYLSDNRERDVFQRDLEKEFGITRSTASKVVNLMEQKGLVEKRSVSYDARLKKLVLTEKSEAIAHLMSDDITKLESVLTDGFSDDELDTLYGYIDRIKNNIKNYKPSTKEEN